MASASRVALALAAIGFGGVAGSCQRAGSGPQPEVEVALQVDGAAVAPVRIRRGETIVVAGAGQGNPAWVSARGRGTDGRFVTAALARYPQGELRLVWRDADKEPTLAFHDGAGDASKRLSEARGVQVIDFMTLKGAAARPKPVARTGVVVVSAAGEKTITAEAIESVEAESIQTGRRRGALLADLLAKLEIDSKTVGEIVLQQQVGDPVRLPGTALRAKDEMVVVRYNKRGELRVFHERGGNTVNDARNVTRIELTAAR